MYAKNPKITCKKRTFKTSYGGGAGINSFDLMYDQLSITWFDLNPGHVTYLTTCLKLTAYSHLPAASAAFWWPKNRERKKGRVGEVRSADCGVSE